MTDPTEALQTLRQTSPLVQCITNYVAMNFSANVLLAAGAAPAMVHAAEEAGDFAAVASALTINIGTASPMWVDGMKAAILGAKANGKPWILDPVAHFATPWRAGVARDLVALAPTVIRANASEIIALAGGASAGRGVDAGDSVEAAEVAARQIAGQIGGVVAVTGAMDFVTDGSHAVRVGGGSDLMTKITASGCALTCLVGGYVAVAGAFDGTVAALAHFKTAGEMAAREAEGPGSFSWRFLDALAAVMPDVIDAGRVVAV